MSKLQQKVRSRSQRSCWAALTVQRSDVSEPLMAGGRVLEAAWLHSSASHASPFPCRPQNQLQEVLGRIESNLFDMVMQSKLKRVATLIPVCGARPRLFLLVPL